MSPMDIIVDAGLNNLDRKSLSKVINDLEPEDKDLLKNKIDDILKTKSNNYIDTVLVFGAKVVKEVL